MKPTRKQIWTIAYPILISLLMENMIGLTDTAFLGRVGEVELGASALGSVYYLVIFMLGFGFGIGAQILIARRNGEKAYDLIGPLFQQGLLFLLSLAAVMFVISHTFTPMVLRSLISSDEVYEAAVSYTNWRVFGFFFAFVAIMFRAFFVGITNTKTLTLNSIVMVLSNVVLNYVLVFGKLGLPACGVRGAAIATLVSQLVNLALIATGFLHCLRQDGERVQPSLHFTKITRWDYLGMITPILVSQFLWSLGQNVESAVYGHLGTQNLAAYTLTCPIQSLIVGALSGLSAAAGVLIGKRLGRKEYDAAYGDAKKIMVTGLVGAAVVSSLLVGLAGQYVGLYRVEGEVRTLGHMLLVVFALYAPIKVENMILGGGILKSGGNTRMVMIIDIAGTWGIGIPLCFFAAYVLHWGIVGVYTLLTAEELFRLVVSLVVFRKRKWMVSLA